MVWIKIAIVLNYSRWDVVCYFFESFLPFPLLFKPGVDFPFFFGGPSSSDSSDLDELSLFDEEGLPCKRDKRVLPLYQQEVLIGQVHLP